MKDLRAGEPVKQICCYKCNSKRSLVVEEKVDSETKRIIEKNFICLNCAGGPEKVFNISGRL